MTRLSNWSAMAGGGTGGAFADIPEAVPFHRDEATSTRRTMERAVDPCRSPTTTGTATRIKRDQRVHQS